MAYTNSNLVSYTKLSPNHSGQRTHSIEDSFPVRASADVFPVHPDRQAVIMALAMMGVLPFALRRRTAVGVLPPMPMISVPSLSSVPVMCLSHMR